MPKKPFSRFSRKFLLFFFIALWSTFLLFSSGVIESQDGWLYLSVSKNIYYEHKIESIPDYYPTLNVHMNSVRGTDGVWRAPGSLGYSFAMLPAVALSDLTHHIEGSSPPAYFPLEHDWSLHFFASMTNTFWGAVLATVTLLYIFDLTHSKKTALVGALIGSFATNLFPLTKFSFPHILFTTFVVICFYCTRKFATNCGKKYLLFALLSYVGVAIAYNVSYYIPIAPLILYYFLLIPPSLRRSKLKWFVVIAAPLVVWKLGTFIGFLKFLRVYPKVVFEGLWGFLFSPGKSIFLYSPPLLIPLIFWNKLKRQYLPEILAFGLFIWLYLYLLSSAFFFAPNGTKVPIWYGGMVWGPRYISTLIPFGIILTGLILPTLQKYQKILIVGPILVLGLWIQLVGASLPYLLQYQGLPPQSVYISDQELSVYDYASFIPRFTPLYSMSRELITKIRGFKRTIDHGAYNVRFYDGFEVPLFTGLGPYRGMRSEGHVFFDSPHLKPTQSLSFSFYNALDVPESSSAAQLKISVNGSAVGQSVIPPSGNAQTKIDLGEINLIEKQNKLDFSIDYPATTSALQVVYISQMKINDTLVNLETLDYPEISTVGDKNSSIKYQYFGKTMNDRWKLWYLRARISERTFDFWWVKNLYYWDGPRYFLWALLMIVLSVSGLSWFWLVQNYQSMKKNQ